MSAVTRTVAAAALAAALCFPSAAYAASPDPPCARALDLPITVYNGSRMTASELDGVVGTARSLWRPYGVTLAPVQEHGIAVILSDGRADRGEHEAARVVLGTTMFKDGHAVPYIHLWVGAAEALLNFSAASQGSSLPTVARDSRLLPMLGVALAHEIGHYLLDMAGHSVDGMLRRVIPYRDLEHPTLERLGLSVEQQNALCLAKENHAPALLK